MFPVDAHTIARLPCSSAFATATTMPRSLKEPVGFNPSSLKCSDASPIRCAITLEETQGVAPSPSEMRGVASPMGSHSA